jgi:hypothetical protein
LQRCGHTLTRSFGAIRLGGKISLIGGLSGPATELNPGLIFARRANVQGISVGSMQMFEAMNRAITANGIKPVIDKVFCTRPTSTWLRARTSAKSSSTSRNVVIVDTPPSTGRIMLLQLCRDRPTFFERLVLEMADDPVRYCDVLCLHAKPEIIEPPLEHIPRRGAPRAFARSSQTPRLDDTDRRRRSFDQPIVPPPMHALRLLGKRYR